MKNGKVVSQSPN